MTGALVVYLALALVLTWPLVLRMSTRLPHDLGDPLLVSWVLWWNAEQTPLTEAWWNPPFLYPSHSALAFSEHLLGFWPIATPLQWLGFDAVVAYNVLFIASFALSGFTAFLLCREVGLARAAAVVGGLAFMCAPYRAVHVSHLQLLALWWLPLMLLSLHRAAATMRWRWFLLAALAWAAQGLHSGYFLLLGLVGVAVWLAWFAGTRWVIWGRMLLSGAAVSVLLLPIVSRYRETVRVYNFAWSREEVAQSGADVSGLWQAPPLNAIWGTLIGSDAAERQLFPGVAILGLSLCAFYWARPQFPFTRIHTALFALAALFLAAAIVATVAPFQTAIAGVPISLTSPEKTFALAWLSLAAALTTLGSSMRARAQGSVVGGYLVLGVVAWVFALGPMPRFNDALVWYHSPYSLLERLPGFDLMRVPARFWIIATLALAVLAAHGAARLLNARRRELVAALGVAIVAEGAFTLPLKQLPAAVPVPAEARLVIELPLGDPIDDAIAMWHHRDHRRPVVNGWSGHLPIRYQSMTQRLRASDATVLREVARNGPLGIIINREVPGYENQLQLAKDAGAVCRGDSRYYSCVLAAQPPGAAALLSSVPTQ